MRLLIVGLNFAPELTGIGKYTGELAAFLGARGHEVRVVSAPPYYPSWQVQPGYSWWRYRREELGRVRVYRVPTWVPRRPTGLRRIAHLLSFSLSTAPALLAQIAWRPEVVLCMAPTLFAAPFALSAARACGAMAWLHLHDFELEMAMGLGILPLKAWLLRPAAWVERRVLAGFDRVTTIAAPMLGRLREKGVQPARLGVFPNWVDTAMIYPLAAHKAEARSRMGLPAGKTVVLYAGNMGAKQGLDRLVAVARRIGPASGIHFALCGEGPARAGLQALAEGLPHVQFLPLQPVEELNALLNAADMHLLPQQAAATDLVMPSKLSAMLASGVPVIATADADSEVGRVVAATGSLVPPGDEDGLRRAIEALASSEARRERLGRLGRAYACEHWSAERVLSEFERGLLACTAQDR